MKIAGWKEGIGGNIIAQVVCEKCGHLGVVSCEKLSDLKYALCDACGHLNMDKDGARVYKGASELLGNEEVEVDKTVHREGIARIVREYNNMKRKGKLDTNVFRDKDDFLKWSFNHGYKDWKVLRVNEKTGMVDNGARWVASTYGLKLEVEGVNEDSAKEIIARSVESYLDDSKKQLEKAVEVCVEMRDKLNKSGSDVGKLQSVGELLSVEEKISRVMLELDRIGIYIDRKVN